MFYTVRAIILQSFEKICKNGNYVIYVDYSLVLQLHIEDGRILNSNEQKYLMLNKSFGGHQLEINHHLLEDSQNLDSAIARKNTFGIAKFQQLSTCNKCNTIIMYIKMKIVIQTRHFLKGS